MTADQYASFSNYSFGAATIVVALAMLAHIVEWSAARRVADVPVRAGGDGPAEGEAATEEYRIALFGRVGIALTVVAAGVGLAGVITRSAATERVPWGNMYEFSTTGTVLVLAIYLALLRVWRLAWLGLPVTAFALATFGLSMTVYVPAGPLVPALDSPWYVVHVGAVVLAGALFTVGAALTVLFLVKDRVGDRGLWRRLPAAAVIDQLAFRIYAAAFPLWTFGALIAGPIWAQYAWSRFWGWDPKEVWALITWIVYAGYLHARMTAGWKGRRAAVIALVGFACFLFSYYGVNLFVTSLHSYAT